jgi:orotidine-5'-phosphate decarboxylase
MGAFFKNLKEVQKSKKTFLCVGLDPNPSLYPGELKNKPEATLEFLKTIVDHTLDWACAYKPQIAYFSALGLEQELVEIIQYIKLKDSKIPVILDSKRNDIGSTAERYAQEAFIRYQAQAVTVNPYMGGDTIEPFSNYKDHGLFVLCRTSNEGAKEFQNLTVGDGEPLYRFVAHRALNSWNKNDNIGLVVGATAINELRKIRGAFPGAWFLVPGVGAQGGDLDAVIEYGKCVGETGGLIINSARGIIYAGDGEDYGSQAGLVAGELQKRMEPHF